MKPKINPIYIPLAKVLLWATAAVLLGVVTVGVGVSMLLAKTWTFNPELLSTIVQACQTLALIGLSVLGFHGFPRGRE